MTHDKDAFEAGYLLVCANIMHLFREEVIARHVLQEGDIAPDAVRRLQLGTYDAKALNKLFREIELRDGL